MYPKSFECSNIGCLLPSMENHESVLSIQSDTVEKHLKRRCQQCQFKEHNFFSKPSCCEKVFFCLFFLPVIDFVLALSILMLSYSTFQVVTVGLYFNYSGWAKKSKMQIVRVSTKTDRMYHVS